MPALPSKGKSRDLSFAALIPVSAYGVVKRLGSPDEEQHALLLFLSDSGNGGRAGAAEPRRSAPGPIPCRRASAIGGGSSLHKGGWPEAKARESRDGQARAAACRQPPAASGQRHNLISDQANMILLYFMLEARF